MKRSEPIRCDHPALERALDSDTVACVNVMLDPDAPARAGMVGYAL
ncbi:MAG: hypothetical protein ABI333_17225 [bacterium]